MKITLVSWYSSRPCLRLGVCVSVCLNVSAVLHLTEHLNVHLVVLTPLTTLESIVFRTRVQFSSVHVL